MGAVLREQNALPYGGWITVKLTAKDDVDNVGAGRAAKGENPSACAKKSTSFDKFLVDFYSSQKAWYVIAAGVCNHSLWRMEFIFRLACIQF